MLEQLIQPITGPYSHSGFGDFISIKKIGSFTCAKRCFLGSSLS